MSSTYNYKGVTIDAQGGGYYELSHPKLTDVERVRGKEKAEQRADELLAQLGQAPDPETTIDQGDLAAAAAALLPPAAPEDRGELETAAQLLVAKDAQIAELRRQLEEATVRPTVATVHVTEGPVPDRVDATVPRAYTGVLSDEQKKAIGRQFTRIVLEEQDDIPPTGLFVSHNFRPYMIGVGEPVDVPDFLVRVLNDARMSAPIVDSKTRKVLGYRERSKYPYRLA